MPTLVLAASLSRWLDDGQPAGERVVESQGAQIDQVLRDAFERHPGLRGYVLDDQGGLRHHVALFVDGVSIRDKQRLQQPLPADATLHLMQALSGG